MQIYEIKPVSLPNGEFAAAWFDDERRLWEDDRLHRADPIALKWQPPTLTLPRSERDVTDVLFNPNAYAVSANVRNALGNFPEIEFLPIAIGKDTYFILHVLASFAPPSGCDLRRAPPPSENIIELFAFPAGYAAQADFFRVLQPKDSAAGAARCCTRAIYASPTGARAIEGSCGRYLWAREVRRDAPLAKGRPML
jgi:hypothetical protein